MKLFTEGRFVTKEEKNAVPYRTNLNTGYIYMVQMGKYLKIGMTHTPRNRFQQYSSQLSLVGFNVEHYVLSVEFCLYKQAEKEMFRRLSDYRLFRNRELFDISMEDAMPVFEDVVKSFIAFEKIDRIGWWDEAHWDKEFKIIDYVRYADEDELSCFLNDALREMDIRDVHSLHHQKRYFKRLIKRLLNMSYKGRRTLNADKCLLGSFEQEVI